MNDGAVLWPAIGLGKQTGLLLIGLVCIVSCGDPAVDEDAAQEPVADTGVNDSNDDVVSSWMVCTPGETKACTDDFK